MALITCPECGKQISSLAEVCPNCGYPIAKLREQEETSSPVENNAAAELQEEEPIQEETEISTDNSEEPSAGAEPEPESEQALPKKKKGKGILIALAVIVLASAAAFYFLLYKPYTEAMPAYTEAMTKYSGAVDAFTEHNASIEAQNETLMNSINDLQQIIDSDDEPFDPDTITQALDAINNAKISAVDPISLPIYESDPLAFTPSVFNPTGLKEQTQLVTGCASELQSVIDQNAVPDYSEQMKAIAAAKIELENSIKQLKQITNPSEAFVIERLQGIPGIVSIEAATENHDPNGHLHKAGGYTSAVYFIHDGVTDQYTISIGSSPVDRGTDGGGQIEVYETVENAESRRDYLASLDNVFGGNGSHTVYGTVLIRTSNKLTATQQNELEKAIIAALIELR